MTSTTAAMVPDPTFRPYEIADGFDTVEFVGRKIGHASSRKAGDDRWTEILIFKLATAGDAPELDRYVIQNIGRSVRYHRGDARCRSGGNYVPNRDITDEMMPCPICHPPAPDELDDIVETDTSLYKVEVDRPQVREVNRPQAVRAALIDRNGGLSTVSEDALNMARGQDPALRQVIGVRRRIA